MKLDSLLLSHMAAQMKSLTQTSPAEAVASPLAIFLSLLPGPIAGPETPPICSKTLTSKEDLAHIYARFGNNNFAIHSHLNTYAHGVFPLASRLFNHSCLPNAAARYVLSDHKQVTMEVIALREILAEEEVNTAWLAVPSAHCTVSLGLFALPGSRDDAIASTNLRIQLWL